MCTVTLIPTNKKFILTSNRDEAIGRETLPIDRYQLNGTRMIFPKDQVAGGTWIAVTERQQMLCLLNGGFKDHTKLNHYRHSRGVVVTDILSQKNLWKSMQDYNCDNLEPFTLVGVDWSKELSFYELVWDGTEKHLRVLDSTIPHIWSSSTLYTEPMKQMRKDWFADYKLNNEVGKNSILDFHKTGGIGNEFYDLLIKRGNLQTRSITQVCIENESPIMMYEDLVVNRVFETSFDTVNI